jgi:hypothetical protein
MPLVGVTGHQDIPPTALAYVESGIESALIRLDDNVAGVSSLSAGADQIFADVVLRMGGRLHVVIPCQRYVDAFSDGDAVRRFESLLRQASTVETLKYTEPSEEAFWQAGRRIVELSQVIVAVWDGAGSKGKGGTADVVRYAQERGTEVIIVWPSGVCRDESRAG